MGARGPVQGTGGRPLHRKTGFLPSLLPSKPLEPPVAPDGLGEAGGMMWGTLWAAVPWLDESQHAGVVEELCRLSDELAAYRHALEEHGALIAEPILSPQGFVAGERLVANPAEQMARRAGAAIEKLWAVLGLTPAARARLGLDHLSARRTMQTIQLREGGAA